MHRSVNTKIDLNETERKIVLALTAFTEQHNRNLPENDQLVLRITGGWVRDKLLGDESNDLDIAVNNLTGETFAVGFIEWAAANQVDLGDTSNTLHTIKKNPDKSKHLETCTTRIMGLDVDFVNLRNEQYSDNSRVPVIECGTAEEDALRRDATLNALFYNINEDRIEDLTGRGLEDLQNGLLRTPLPPLQTFLDDPLRILRLIRFACRFGFTVEPGALEAMRDERIKVALDTKISRERIGVELHKILTSNDVPYGLRLIHNVDLTESIFSVGTLADKIASLCDDGVKSELEVARDLMNKRIDESTRLIAQFRQTASEYPKLACVVDEIFTKKLSQQLFWLCVVLQPYGGIRVSLKPNKYTSYVELVIKEGLRFGKNDYDVAAKVLERLAKDLFLGLFFVGPHGVLRLSVGNYVRQFGDHFGVSVAVNAFQDYIVAVGPTPSHELHPEPLQPGRTEVLAKHEKLLEVIQTLGLENVKDMRPLVDGKMVASALQRKPGPWMTRVTAEVLTWQMDHPKGLVEQCLDHLRKSYAETVKPN